MAFFAVSLLLQGILLSACSNPFHLRKELNLAKAYQHIQLENISLQSDFARIFENALEEAGGQLTHSESDYSKPGGAVNSTASKNTVSNNTASKVIINKLREGKNVVAYTSERKARIYLVFLKIEYTIENKNKNSQKQRISLDKTFIYDASFALGKAEEEKKIREELYAEAARLILLKLQYSNETLP